MAFKLLSLVAGLALLTSAQISSSCNPSSQQCAPFPGLQQTQSWALTGGSFPSSDFEIDSGNSGVSITSQGLECEIASASDVGPVITSKNYIWYGKVSWEQQNAIEPGIVSSFFLLSPCDDEIDLECVQTTAQTNYFAKGNTTTYDRGQNFNVAGMNTRFVAYEIDWTETAITFSIDGQVMRTITAEAAGVQYPNTPASLRFGNWCGYCSTKEGTREWAGGPVNWANGPFTQIIRNLTLTPYNPAQSYVLTGCQQSQISMNGKGATNQTSATLTSPLSTATTSTASTLSTTTTTNSSSSSSTTTHTTSVLTSSTSSSTTFSTTATTTTTKPTTTSSSSTTVARATTSPTTSPVVQQQTSSAFRTGVCMALVSALVFITAMV